MDTKQRQGEKLPEYRARIKAWQQEQRALVQASIKNERAMRKARKEREQEVSDFDYSMNG